MKKSFWQNLIDLFNEDFSQVDTHPFARTKGAERIQVNNILAAIGITLVTILISKNSSNSDNDKLVGLDWVLSELAISIPLLITSSLFYSKVCYRYQHEYATWNTSAWFSHTIGYFCVINSIVLLLIFNGFVLPGLLLISTNIILVILYSLIDVNASNDPHKKAKRRKEKRLKFLIYSIIWFFGILWPLGPKIIHLFRCG